jgi:hypothetical protein
MHRQEPGDLVAGGCFGEEQDSQGTAQTEGHSEIIPRMGLRLQNSKPFGIGAHQLVIKHTSRKHESGPLGIELALGLKRAAVRAAIGRLRVREKDSIWPPVGSAKLPHDAKHRSDIDIVDLLNMLCTLLINHRAYGHGPFLWSFGDAT